jgi:exonuclease SbcD
MKLLHTSDWHLGQTLHDFDRSHEHRCFLEWLVERLVEEAADALIVAGDVFDTANPSAASQRLFYRFLVEARRALPKLDVVVVAGNHDSPGRREAPAPLLEGLDVKIVGQLDPRTGGADHVVPLRRADGAVGAWCLAVPYLRASDVPRVEAEGDAFAAGVAAVYRQALEAALSRRTADQAIVAVGHLHLAGGQTSELSERKLTIGGVEALSASMFDERCAYVALGHLHLAQQVSSPRIRYSGSPLPMSFAEVSYPHQVIVVELEGTALVGTRALPVPRAVELLRVPADGPAKLEEVLAELGRLRRDAVPLEQRPYLQVRVKLEAHEPALRARVEAALEGKPVRLAGIEASVGRSGEAAVEVSMERLQRLDPEEILTRLHRKKFDRDPPQDLLLALAELQAKVSQET